MDDGTGYTAFTCGDQGAVLIARLDAAYTSFDTASGAWVTALAAAREAPCLFKRGGVHFLINSSSNYHNSGATFDPKYAACSTASPLGAWGANANLFASDPVGSAYNGRPAFVLRVNGKTDEFVYGSRHAWLPYTFPTSATLRDTTPAEWGLEDLTSRVARNHRG